MSEQASTVGPDGKLWNLISDWASTPLGLDKVAIADQIDDYLSVRLATQAAPPVAETAAPGEPMARALIEECRSALAEELMGWDLDPPLHHVKQAHDRCVAWLAAPSPAVEPAPQGAEPAGRALSDGGEELRAAAQRIYTAVDDYVELRVERPFAKPAESDRLRANIHAAVDAAIARSTPAPSEELRAAAMRQALVFARPYVDEARKTVADKLDHFARFTMDKGSPMQVAAADAVADIRASVARSTVATEASEPGPAYNKARDELYVALARTPQAAPASQEGAPDRDRCELGGHCEVGAADGDHCGTAYCALIDAALATPPQGASQEGAPQLPDNLVAWSQLPDALLRNSAMDLLEIYAQCKGQWFLIARAVEEAVIARMRESQGASQEGAPNAKRYVWLRQWWFGMKNPPDLRQALSPEELDAAIDKELPPTEGGEPDYLAIIGSLGKALRTLSLCAQTSGGVSGRDEGLSEAIAGAEQALSVAGLTGAAYPQGASQEAAAEGGEPVLPADLVCDNMTFRKGVPLSTVAGRMNRLRLDAYGPLPTKEEAEANLAVLQGRASPPAHQALKGAAPAVAAGDDTSATNAKRLAWLHSPASLDVDGYEWGIFQVKWPKKIGQAVEVLQTYSDFSDLDAAIDRAALRPSGEQR